ncbi:MAG: alpha/beta fold hydrolase [Psychroflexus halocasei]
MKSINLRSPLYYDKRGNGNHVLLFVHGFLESSKMWNSVLSHFDQEKYTVYTIDLPGHGDSPVFEEANNLEKLAELIFEFVKLHKIDELSIIGHSLGGYIALAFAEKYPDILQKLILLNSTSLSDSDVRKKDRNRAIELLKKHPQAFKSMAVRNLFLPETHQKYKYEINKAAEVAQQCETEALILTTEAMRDRRNRSDILNQFSSQSLLIFGDQDQIASFQYIESVIEKYDLNTAVLSGGHMSLIEHPEKVIQLIKEFL